MHMFSVCPTLPRVEGPASSYGGRAVEKGGVDTDNLDAVTVRWSKEWARYCGGRDSTERGGDGHVDVHKAVRTRETDQVDTPLMACCMFTRLVVRLAGQDGPRFPDSRPAEMARPLWSLKLLSCRQLTEIWSRSLWGPQLGQVGCLACYQC